MVIRVIEIIVGGHTLCVRVTRYQKSNNHVYFLPQTPTDTTKGLSAAAPAIGPVIILLFGIMVSVVAIPVADVGSSPAAASEAKKSAEISTMTPQNHKTKLHNAADFATHLKR